MADTEKSNADRDNHYSNASPSPPSLPPRKRRLSISPESSSHGSYRKRRHSVSPESRSPGYYGDYMRDSEGDEDGTRRTKRRREGREVEVCRDFVRSRCSRLDVDCKYAHPHPGVITHGDKVTVCSDSLRNQCFRGVTCRYYHPPLHLKMSLLKGTDESAKSGIAICRDFLRGRCARAESECRFLHHTSIHSYAVVCQDFLRGRCSRKHCRYSHAHAMPPMHAMQQMQTMRPMPDVPVAYPEMVYMQPIPMPVMMPRSPPRLTGTDTMPVCKDFMKNLCNREHCKFAHPKPHVKVVDDKVEICRDFQRGACERSSCRFYHLPVNGNSTLTSLDDNP